MASGLAVVVLTIGGSFVDLQFGRLIASVFDIQRTHVQQGLLAFWVVPSLCVFCCLRYCLCYRNPVLTGQR